MFYANKDNISLSVLQVSSFTMTNTSNSTLEGCPNFTQDQMRMVESFAFMVEGVAQTIISILGLIGNALAAYILSRKEMRNAFNLLLVTLACFDSTYLFGSILESFRKQFGMASNVHIVLFPYFLYPFNQMAITGSIFMTVAIALERYIAVHYPLDYSQAMHEANALSKRIFKYVASVILLSVIFTFTRFFEATVTYEELIDETTNQTVGYQAHLEPTELRTAPLYTVYFNWSRLIVLGIIPFVMLVYLNTKIYQDIKARRKRRFNTRCPAATMTVNPVANGQKQQFKVQLKIKEKTDELPDTEVTVVGKEPCRINSDPDENKDLKTNNDPVPTVVQSSGKDTKTSVDPAPIRRPQPQATVSNESRRKKEDNMAVIFMGFILVFLVCHLPRLLLNIHELATIQHAMMCQADGKHPFPPWSLITISCSHVLLVINSSTNIFIYCFLSSKFREECTKVYQGFLRRVC